MFEGRPASSPTEFPIAVAVGLQPAIRLMRHAYLRL